MQNPKEGLISSAPNYFLVGVIPHCTAWREMCIPNFYRLSQNSFQSHRDNVAFRHNYLFNNPSSREVSSISHRNTLPVNQWLWYDHATPIFPDLLDPAFEGRACAGWNLQRMATYSKYLLIGVPVAVLASCAALWLREKLRKRSFKEVGRVSGIFVYPVKSCKGIRVRDVKCFKEGMEYDRWDKVIRKARQLPRSVCLRVCFFIQRSYLTYSESHWRSLNHALQRNSYLLF